MKRIIIAGVSSGCGKTTVTCAVMKALINRNLSVSSFKCGCDYIDPMFHEKVVGTSAYNLDGFFCNDNTINYLLCENSKSTDISVIEGVMGFYDGGRGSAHNLSEITDTKAIIVIDCKGMSDSIGAVMTGFLNYRKNNIIGFIFNNLPEKLTDSVERMCREVGTEYFGFMPKNNFTVQSRHLGLITADEVTGLKEKITELGKIAENYIKIDRIIEVSESTEPNYTSLEIKKYPKKPVIAVARDKAFCFIYRDNIVLLEKYGCEIKYFSPLEDKRIPENTCGLLLYGGYPELYAEKLSCNKSILGSIKSAVNSGMPVVAECGGFMYLHDFIESDSGKLFPMVGLISGKSFKTSGLKRFGYANLYPEKESMLFEKSDNIAVHEFHYWDSNNCGNDLKSVKADGRSWYCGHCNDTMYAGFPHIYFYSNLSATERFIKACINYGETNGKNKLN